jgi:hypothetical protein
VFPGTTRLCIPSSSMCLEKATHSAISGCIDPKSRTKLTRRPAGHLSFTVYPGLLLFDLWLSGLSRSACHVKIHPSNCYHLDPPRSCLVLSLGRSPPSGNDHECLSPETPVAGDGLRKFFLRFNITFISTSRNIQFIRAICYCESTSTQSLQNKKSTSYRWYLVCHCPCHTLRKSIPWVRFQSRHWLGVSSILL